MLHDLYLVEVKKPGGSKKPWDYYKVLQTIPVEQAFPRLEEGSVRSRRDPEAFNASHQHNRKSVSSQL
jgi:hypothetical protein